MATHSVIIDNCLDGACAGAVYLLKHPKARVFISSAHSLSSRLSNLKEWDSHLTSTVICGIGYRGIPEKLSKAMQSISKQGVKVSWFIAGKGYPEYEAAVEGLCTLRKAPDHLTTTEAMITLLRLESHPRAPLLTSIAVAGQFAKLKDPEVRTFAELAVASMFRFFQLDDREQYPASVRKLAGVSPITEDDLAILRRYRALGHQDGPDGSSRKIKDVRRLVRLFGPLDSLNILVLGETGTGKERVARLLHQESNRIAQNFIAVNCAILSGTDMLESKLFGHVKGAFTGSLSDHDGVIATADKGTLFLDEIGDMPLDTQAKLLRVIEDGTFNRLGSNESMKVDVRIIAATNMNLADMVRQSRFRIDLYYRLRELVVRIPPLRERLDDIGHIAGSIRRALSQTYRKRFPDLSIEQIDLLRTYSWPGNIRQLHSVLNRAYLLGIKEHLEPALIEEQEEGLDQLLNLPCKEADSSSTVWCDRHTSSKHTEWKDQSELTLRQIQILHAEKVLNDHDGNLTATAKALDISVNTLKKLRREGIELG